MAFALPSWPLIGPNAASLLALAAIAFGLLSCFAGYRLFKVILALYGAALGALVGIAVAGELAAERDFVVLLAGIGGGLVGAFLLSTFYYVGVFVIGAVGGLILADMTGISAELGEIGRAISGVVVGVAALALQRLVITVATALSGAWSVVGGAVALLGLGPPAILSPFSPLPDDPWRSLPSDLALYVWLGLSIAGVVVQLAAPNRREHARKS